MHYLMIFVLFFSFLNTSAAEAQRVQQPAIRGAQTLKTGTRVVQNGFRRHYVGPRRYLRARGVITRWSPAGVFFGAGWFPYWGVRFNYPLYVVPYYGHSYYQYWHYGIVVYTQESFFIFHHTDLIDDFLIIAKAHFTKGLLRSIDHFAHFMLLADVH